MRSVSMTKLCTETGDLFYISVWVFYCVKFWWKVSLFCCFRLWSKRLLCKRSDCPAFPPAACVKCTSTLPLFPPMLLKRMSFSEVLQLWHAREGIRTQMPVANGRISMQENRFRERGIGLCPCLPLLLLWEAHNLPWLSSSVCIYGQYKSAMSLSWYFNHRMGEIGRNHCSHLVQPHCSSRDP